MLSKQRVQNFDRPARITGRNVEVLVALHATPADVEDALKATLPKVPAILRTPPSKAWFVQMTPLYHRYVMRLYVDDFSIHDDVESDFLKAMFNELSARGLHLGGSGAVAAVDFEGKTTVAATTLPPPSEKTQPQIKPPGT